MRGANKLAIANLRVNVRANGRRGRIWNGKTDGNAGFKIKEAQKKGTLCKMQNRSDKRNPITRKPKEHFPSIKKYSLKTGY